MSTGISVSGQFFLLKDGDRMKKGRGRDQWVIWLEFSALHSGNVTTNVTLSSSTVQPPCQ